MGQGLAVDMLFVKVESESHSVVSDSLWPYGRYSPWNSPRQNTGVGSLSLVEGSSQSKDRTQVSSLQEDSLLAEPQGIWKQKTWPKRIDEQ